MVDIINLYLVSLRHNNNKTKVIVAAMTHQQIADECQNEWRDELYDKTMKILLSEKYRKFIMKEARSEKRIYFKSIEFVTKRKNSCVIQPFSKGWSLYKKRGLSYFVYLRYHRSDGLHAVVFSAVKGISYYIFYTPHFFDRYKERELKDTSMPKIQAIHEFFKYNANVDFFSVEIPKYPDSMFGVSLYGVVLAVRVGRNLIEGRTYLPFEMLKGEQLELSADLLGYLRAFLEHKFGVIV